RSEATLLGLAEALATQSKVASLERDEKETLRLGDEALEVLRPLSGAAQPSRPVMRLHAEMLESRGFNLHRREPELAIRDLQQAREIYNKLGAQDLSNIAAAASYASSGYWLGLAYGVTGRRQEAQSVFEEALAMANRVIDVMPGHTTALYAKGNIAARLAGFEVDELRMDRALALVQEGRQTWEGLLKIAPTNAVYRNNYGVTRGEVANTLWQLGRFNESRRERRELVDMGAKPGDVSAFYMSNMMVWATDLAAEEAELGNRAGAAEALARHVRFKEAYLKMAPPSVETDWWVYFAEANKVRVALANGDPREGARIGAAALAKAEKLAATRKSHEVSKDILRYRINLGSALAQERLGDHAAAEASARGALEAWGRLPRGSDIRDERDKAWLNAMMARAMARQGRQGEAATLIAPVIDFHRKQYARRHDNRWQHFLFAEALYTGALSDPARRRVMLAEATAVLAGLPPTMNGWKPLAQLREDIAAIR
ncbi:MAG: hypothetical protein NDI88_14870, partial [Lysobacter sp.]|nr:hypothetical protein [Lysobacter sp.]